jgi:hypothetical protein
MSDRPRRSRQRSRPPQRKYPLIPILVVVLLAGFVIGASFAFVQRVREGPPRPLATPTLPPAITPSPVQSAALLVSPSPAPSPSVTPTPAASASPSASPAASPSPTASPSASASPAASPLATARATGSPTAEASVDADSDFARLASVVVRQYLAALERGDDAAAYAAFGVASGASGVTFVEKRYVDQTTRIVRVSSSGTDDAATVDVELETGGATYFAQYFLTRSAAGSAVIQRHSIAKS